MIMKYLWIASAEVLDEENYKNIRISYFQAKYAIVTA